MKYLSVSSDEIHEIKKLYASILSKSSHGLFHSTGKIIGESITKEISDPNIFFDEVARLLKERGIVEGISFNEKKVVASGSIEALADESTACDILRGIIAAVYLEHYGKKVYCEETQCESTGADKCKFEIKEDII